VYTGSIPVVALSGESGCNKTPDPTEARNTVAPWSA
jgi:hypothetical protein